MNRQELFDKYGIKEIHNQLESADSHFSIELYRLMHDGNLPDPENTSLYWLVDFLDRSIQGGKWWAENVMSRNDWGSLYITTKRMVYYFSEQILEEINGQTKN